MSLSTPVDAARLKGVNLYLVGMMGAGKTTVGRQLARALGYQFFDTDALVEQITQQTIPEIFAQQGESGFRDLETEVLAQVSPFPRLVVATGGGIVLRSLNWSYLHHGVVIWLDVEPSVLLDRLRSESTHRPLLATAADPLATLQHLMEQRRPLYGQADIHIQISSADPPAQVVDWIWTQLVRRLRPEPQPPLAPADWGDPNSGNPQDQEQGG